ncbi:transmembrane protein 269 isoform X5 [Cuculus canorus]|uniref:transmembrane protein 269 isoform X5 n=1 Tax=Cuculus canorus TaxID=55661 RepID=UPI0023AACDC5|nr:transmembrane protein 269 isoform X5 [Cuculus canorus]
MWMVSPPVDEGSSQLAWLWDHGKGVFQATTKKLFLSERAGQGWMLEFIRKNAANGLSVANLVAGLSSILCSLNRQYQYSCWLLLVGFLLDLADGAVARRLDACSALGAKLDDFADFTTFGLATALLLQPQGVLAGLLAVAYVLAVFARLCFFSSAGIPFTYRGLPCPYASSLLAGTFLLADGNVIVLRITAGVMILFMLDQGFYPHDKVLESQRWKKVVYAGGKDRARIKTHRDGSREGADPKGSSQSAGVAAVLFLPTAVASVYCLVWAMSYIVFPFAVWSCKAQPNA